jgi:predicted cupin superfamily sugar epimerase
MEDTGSFQSMLYLDRADKVDKSRFMVLRTGSNYSMPPPDFTALENLKLESCENGYAGMRSALESAYSVGSIVVNDIVANWAEYKTTPPYAAQHSASVAIEAAQTPTGPQGSISDLASNNNQNNPLSAQQLVSLLNLEEHVEGGYFRQTFKAEHRALIDTAGGPRVTMSSIYYLLTIASPIGHFHMNQSDIMHYFHGGDPISYFMLKADGRLQTTILGPDPGQGHQLQMMVKGGTWKASQIAIDAPYGYGLIGEAVAPGFDYKDMQLGETSILLQQFPQHAELINRLSR